MAKPKTNAFCPYTRFDYKKRCYVIGPTRLTGVKPWLKKRFFPDYNINTASKKGAYEAKKKANPKKSDPNGKSSKKNAKVTGLKRGMRVDTQIKAWFEGQKIKTAEHAYTRKFRSYCKKNDWIPVIAQLAVGCKERRVGTAIDAIVQEAKSKRFIAIEIKCGHDKYFETSTGKMKAPLQNIDNSALNQAFLQLTTSMFIHANNMEHSRRKINLKVGKIIQITDDGIAEYDLPEWCSSFWKHLKNIM